ncbi:MAG: ATP-binding cassette domain-containing protein [Proteobacteria bacterium]|nr:MAG: ATP-binding cassette domain-containing protein [Pseudomonadota bacterium]
MNKPSDSIAVTPEASLPIEKPEPYAIEVEGLSLEIAGQKLLSDIDFKIAPGEFVAIVGEVGSGKSLLVLSLAGETGAQFKKFELQSPSVAKNALTLPLDERRRHFAFVGQEGFVMSASLRENVIFRYEAEGDSTQVVRSLETAQFRVNGEHLTNGLETEIGERGVNLSGGQRQRVALARAHYLDRPIFLLDDCLSAVDVDTERQLITNLIDGAWAGRTRLLITHRLSVLEKVDRIFFMEDGRIVDRGSFAELLERSAKMRDYVASVRRADKKPVGEVAHV